MPCMNSTAPLVIYMPNAKWESRHDPSWWSQSRGSHDLCRDQCRIGLPHEATQLSTRNARLWFQKIQPHWRGEQMYALQIRSPGFDEYRETQGSHCEVNIDASKMNERVGAAVTVISRMVRQPATIVQKTAKQHNLCCSGYSHHSGTELPPVHGSSPTRYSSLFWLNVLLAGNWGRRHWKTIYLPYHGLLQLRNDKGTNVRFCWIPNQCGIAGNERVDNLANETLDHDIDPLTSVHYAD